VWHCNRRNLHSCFSEHEQLRRCSCSVFRAVPILEKQVSRVSPCLCPVLIGFNLLSTLILLLMAAVTCFWNVSML
jgi:hypothetical protein